MAQFAHHVIFGCAFALQMSLTGIALAETPAPKTSAQEDTFLGVLPNVVVPDDIQLIPGAVNVEFRNCRAQWPEEYKQAQSGPEARALRDIYGFVQARNVIATKDCSCDGKVASWQDVETLASALHAEFEVEYLRWQQTKAIAEEADRLTAITENMCGGRF